MITQRKNIIVSWYHCFNQRKWHSRSFSGPPRFAWTMSSLVQSFAPSSLQSVADGEADTVSGWCSFSRRTQTTSIETSLRSYPDGLVAKPITKGSRHGILENLEFLQLWFESMFLIRIRELAGSASRSDSLLPDPVIPNIRILAVVRFGLHQM